ncbi:hypothetical protein [Bradyrhizobium sp.]|uniref:hypothetical protein n=1 Tax=Bradyrhizobium sp. TaxID=376 RepID=UPI001ECE1768|nr:hypothetical protein [Bradyrhizobium sp.]MBV9980617.1 hypothetical protein [Bradyrhizobium sp.]
MRGFVGAVLALSCAPGPADAGFRSPESLIRNVYAYYGNGSPELSDGLPRNADTARQFFDPSLRTAWTSAKTEPYDFLVQSPTWRVGPVSISILRKQYDKTYVSVAFDNMGRSVRLNYILIKEPEGWLITDVESPYDSLRMFLDQFKN